MKRLVLFTLLLTLSSNLYSIERFKRLISGFPTQTDEANKTNLKTGTVTESGDKVLLDAAATTYGIQPDGDPVPSRADGIATDVNGASVKTTTPLTAGASYVSGWVDSDGFKSIEISIKTDQLSADNGIIVEYTNDANIVIPLPIISRVFSFSQNDLTQGDLNIFVPTREDGFRLRYVNGAVAQGAMYLSVTLRTSPVQDVSVPIDSRIVGSTNASVTQSVIKGKNESTGEIELVELSPSDSLKVAITDRPSEVRNRTYVTFPIINNATTGAGQIYYTVPAGKILYLESYVIGYYNDQNTDGQIRLRDGTTVIATFKAPAKNVGGTSPAAGTSPSLPEPIRFTTNVNLLSVSGTPFNSGFFIGYLEDI